MIMLNYCQQWIHCWYFMAHDVFLCHRQKIYQAVTRYVTEQQAVQSKFKMKLVHMLMTNLTRG